MLPCKLLLVPIVRRNGNVVGVAKDSGPPGVGAAFIVMDQHHAPPLANVLVREKFQIAVPLGSAPRVVVDRQDVARHKAVVVRITATTIIHIGKRQTAPLPVLHQPRHRLLLRRAGKVQIVRQGNFLHEQKVLQFRHRHDRRLLLVVVGAAAPPTRPAPPQRRR